VYNIPKFDGFHERKQPPVLEDNITEIEAFSRVRFLCVTLFRFQM
jgi:isopenicillin N synthase-like dioxygenase